LQHETENKDDEIFEVDQVSHDLLNNTLFEDETLIIIDINIVEFNDKKKCIKGMWWNKNKNMKCIE
jgi:hypothetical protein